MRLTLRAITSIALFAGLMGLMPAPTAAAPPPGKGKCKPQVTCETEGAQCGTILNDCNKVVDCGSCASDESCNANFCETCVATVDCTTLGAECGTIVDDCNTPVDCGTCDSGFLCNGSNICEAGVAIESFYMNNVFTHDTGKKRDIAGYEPLAAGTYPVYVWTTGTGMTFWDADDEVFTAEMAGRGFVAASVNYNNGFYPNTCSALLSKAQRVFDASDATSPISLICGRAKADCNKGIVVQGFSQGAHIAALARNYDSRVVAAYVTGNGSQATDTNDLSACLASSTLDLPGFRRRSVVGENDEFFGCDPDGQSCNRPGVREQQEITTGIDCGPTAFDCIQADGSGFYIVQNAETADGSAPHCFQYEGICGPNFDANYEGGTALWSLAPCLDWLTSHALP
jgi:hypothetical protein